MRAINTPKRRKSPKTFPRVGNARILEAAAFLNCGRSTVYDMINDGRLRTITVGSQKRIPWEVLWAIHDGAAELAEAT